MSLRCQSGYVELPTIREAITLIDGLQQSLMEHEELASLFGPALTSFIGQDDKAHVPNAITAANKQPPLLMSAKYKVQLPDHDFVIATKHKLTPTVTRLHEIKDAPLADRKSGKYGGPTLI